MSLAPGTRLGPYEIAALIGVGGMGEVYRATDTNLARQVAIKVLPDAVASDTERLARFDREARMLASLNHPHIAQIYGLERTGSIRALVMELVEGPTLADRIAHGAIPIDEALSIAKQIAGALEAAHEQGIIHRDLKPANIKIAPDAVVKVLDFGLAKAVSGDASGPDLTQSPTVTFGGTRDGVILGTAAYMSPEQARGKPVDKRTDVWAFGCVVYEMLTRRRAFAGDTISDTIARVLERDPDWQALPASTPPSVTRLLTRCLDKDPRRRLHDIADARIEIEDALSGASSMSPETAVVRRQSVRRLWIGAVLASAVAASALTWSALTALDTQTAPPRISRLFLTSSGTTTVLPSTNRSLALTTDGNGVVYQGYNGKLFLRKLDQLDPTALTTATAPVNWVFVSPNGRWVGFDQGGSLRKVALTGGPAMTILSTSTGGSRGATWTPDDAIIFATPGSVTGLQRVSADGGDVTVLTKPAPGELDHRWPEMLPGGRAVLFTIATATGGPDAAQVAVLDPVTKAYKPLIRGGSDAHYVQSGHLVYTAGGRLRAVRFDLARLETIGQSVEVLSRLVRKPQGAGDFDVAPNGTLAYLDAPDFGAENTLVWVDRQGREAPLPGAPRRSYLHPRISPDESSVAVVAVGVVSVWDLLRQKPSQVVFGPGHSLAWTFNGRGLLFFCAGVCSRAADGTGVVERLADGLPSGVTPDGKQVLINGVPGSTDVMVLTLGGTLQPLVRTPATERNGVVSPNGRWLAYESDDGSGEFKILVKPFPVMSDTTYEISTGKRPLWAKETGEELFWVAPDGAIMGVHYDARGAKWSTRGNPSKILEGPYENGDPLSVRNYDVSNDGQRFLMVRQPANPNAAPKIIVVENWFEELNRLVPTK